MQVEVGAVDAASMAAFARFGRMVLHSAGPGADVPSDAASSFDAYLDEWTEIAATGGRVTWVTQVDPEVAEYLVYAFYRISKEMDDESGGEVQVVPADAAEFYWKLVGGLLDALESEGGSRAEFAAHLREFWPGDDEGALTT